MEIEDLPPIESIHSVRFPCPSPADPDSIVLDCAEERERAAAEEIERLTKDAYTEESTLPDAPEEVRRHAARMNEWRRRAQVKVRHYKSVQASARAEAVRARARIRRAKALRAPATPAPSPRPTRTSRPRTARAVSTTRAADVGDGGEPPAVEDSSRPVGSEDRVEGLLLDVQLEAPDPDELDELVRAVAQLAAAHLRARLGGRGGAP